MLTEVRVRAARPKEMPYKLVDERGLVLLVTPSGSRLWRLRYRRGRRETMLSLGSYPDVSLKDAREKRDAARRELAAGRDPAQARLDEKERQALTFSAVAREWLSKQKTVKASTLDTTRRILRKWVEPRIGKKPVASVTSADVLAVLRAIEAKELHVTARLARARIGRVLRYGRACGYGAQDVTEDLQEVLTATETRHHPSVKDPAELGALLRAIEGTTGQPSTVFAMKLLPYVALRSKELREGPWTEIDWDAREWRIPAERMKGELPHIVPLSVQAIALLRALWEITGEGALMFPGLDPDQPLSETALRRAMKRIGYAGRQTRHGFRSIFSTCLNELRVVHPDLIELQLAHVERNKVRGAYNAAQHIEARTQLMQAWADYLDELRAGTPPSLAASRCRSAIQASTSVSSQPTA